MSFITFGLLAASDFFQSLAVYSRGILPTHCVLITLDGGPAVNQVSSLISFASLMICSCWNTTLLLCPVSCEKRHLSTCYKERLIFTRTAKQHSVGWVCLLTGALKLHQWHFFGPGTEQTINMQYDRRKHWMTRAGLGTMKQSWPTSTSVASTLGRNEPVLLPPFVRLCRMLNAFPSNPLKATLFWLSRSQSAIPVEI